jgi:D-amino-acid dehydrogenase
MASDGLPIVGPLPDVEGVLVATGHGMLGLTLGPATATLIAEYAMGETVDARWRAFSPERFA